MAPLSIVKLGALESFHPVKSLPLKSGVNPGSTYGSAKRWLPERYAEAALRVCRQIERQQGRPVTVVILGAKGEEELGHSVADRLTVPSAGLSGRTNIR